jgi:hypothetical protein
MKRNMAKKHQHSPLKLEMGEAYDQVDWSYLKAIMLKLGFNSDLVNPVMGMVSVVKFSILFNGSSPQTFKPTRGIYQGDPISPYLFLLAAEGLSFLLKSKSVLRLSNLQGLKVASPTPVVTT